MEFSNFIACYRISCPFRCFYRTEKVRDATSLLHFRRTFLRGNKMKAICFSLVEKRFFLIWIVSSYIFVLSISLIPRHRQEQKELDKIPLKDL